MDEVFKKFVSFQSNVISALEEICELDIACSTLLKQFLEDITSLNTGSLLKIQAIIDYMYEQVNIGNWKEVKPYIRKTITIASYIKLLAHLKWCNELTDTSLRESLKIIDFGILFGCPLEKEPKLLQNCASILSPMFINKNTKDNLTIEEDKIKIDNVHTVPIDILDCPSMETFYKNYILLEKPVVLNNCINHWPALQKWQDQNYFIKIAGLRTISIELGRDYTDSEWTQKLMTIEEFVKNHIFNTNGPTGYLAQYQLFDQIPELKEDIVEPEYCCFSNSNDPIDVMAWYGPRGTLSPLHHDPKRNLLAQVVGKKQLYLFSPKDSDYLYPHEHELLSNTAKVDPRQPDLVKYPNYKNATPYFCVLHPGQMLYIPPKWWHFVESLSISFSVSFWWE